MSCDSWFPSARENPRWRATCASLFTGGGGWEQGAIQAGVRPLWSIEIDPDIAAVVEHNVSRVVPSHRTLVASVLDVEPSGLPRPDIFIASPPCQSHSQARMRESACPRTDADVGSVVIQFVRALRPRHVLLENVHGYRRHPVFLDFVAGCKKLGYNVDFAIVDADIHGVPSSRRRLVARASLDSLPPWPAARRPISWLEAVRDLLPAFPPDKLATWQQARVDRLLQHRKQYPLKYPWLISSNDVSSQRFAAGKVVRVARGADEPAFTIASTYKAMSQTRVLFEDGRVLQVTPRGLARFQSFPDSYALPENNALAVKVVGNAVSPALARALISSFL